MKENKAMDTQDLILGIAADFTSGTSFSDLRDRYQLGSKALFRHLQQARVAGIITVEEFADLLVDRTVHDFPENEEVRLEAVLNSVNSELKQAVVLALNGFPASPTDIWRRIERQTTVQLPGIHVMGEYCNQSLVNIGLVASEEYNRLLIPGLARKQFVISEAGSKYGQPLAAYSLKFAVDNNISLYSVLSSTHSKGDSRAPYNRVRVLEAVRDGASTIPEIAGTGLRLKNLGSVISKQIAQLAKLGLINYQSTGPNKDGQKASSSVSIHDSAQAFLGYVTFLRKALQQGDELQQALELLTEFRRDAQRFTAYLDAGIELYRQVSPHLNAVSHEERVSDITTAITMYMDEHGRGARPVEVARLLGWNDEVTRLFMSSLSKEGTLTKEKKLKGAGVYYRLAGK